MALARDQMGSVQICAFNRNVSGGDLSSPENYGFEEGDALEKTTMIAKNFVMSSSSSISGPRSLNSNGFFLRAADNYCQPEEVRSLINFKNGYDNFMNANGSLLSFEQNEKVLSPQTVAYLKTSSTDHEYYSAWEGDLNHNSHWNQNNPKTRTDPRVMEDFNCVETAANFASITNISAKESQGDWLYSEATVLTTDHSIRESASPDPGCLKRPHSGKSMELQSLKKQCSSNNATKKLKPAKSSYTSKDPQSIAAKNRRERISERLKVLQELVPNGSKVDLVTMLEKAISYVKFLQLQVKVLATDEFWPVQGGKAPDISQVKEAIDAILSSQKDRNSSSK